jgi:hypothetical protein
MEFIIAGSVAFFKEAAGIPAILGEFFLKIASSLRLLLRN